MKKFFVITMCLASTLFNVSAQTKSGGISKEMLKEIQKEVELLDVQWVQCVAFQLYPET